MMAEIFQPVRRAENVGMLHQRHHARAVGGVRVDLLELVARALEIFARRMMLDQHHGDVVAFLRVGHVEDAPLRVFSHTG